MSVPKDQEERTYLGDDISISKDSDGRVWLRREPPGVATILSMDGLVLMELVSWVEDNMPEVHERVRKYTIRPVKATGKSLREWTEEDGQAARVSKHFYQTDGEFGERRGDGRWWFADETERLFGPCATLEEAAEAYIRNLDYLRGEGAGK